VSKLSLPPAAASLLKGLAVAASAGALSFVAAHAADLGVWAAFVGPFVALAFDALHKWDPADVPAPPAPPAPTV